MGYREGRSIIPIWKQVVQAEYRRLKDWLEVESFVGSRFAVGQHMCSAP